jgi:hypothetical protein
MFLIEIVHRGECRRLLLSDPPYCFHSLLSEAIEKFKIPKPLSARIRYQDPFDGDWITLSTDEELLEALEIVRHIKPHVIHMELYMVQQYMPDPVEHVNSEKSGFKIPQGDGSGHAGDNDEDLHVPSHVLPAASNVLVRPYAQDGISNAAHSPRMAPEQSPASPDAASASDAAPHVGAGRGSSYEGHDESLARFLDMGFDDIPKIESLLRSCNGDVDAVLETLFSS